VGRKRFYHHVNEGKLFSESDNLALAEKAAAMLNEEYQGRRNATVLPDGRVTISTKANEIDENVNQQILSLLIAAQAERQALRGNNMQVNMKMSPGTEDLQNTLYELIGRGLLHPDALQVASRGFRHPSRVSTDDLGAKLVEDVIQTGRGYDNRDGAAFTKQYIESGHSYDDNLYPDRGHDIDNIGQQSRIVNKVTADSAKGASNMSPEEKSIADMEDKALDLMRNQYKSGYKDVVYTDDGDLDIYGSALDELISALRSKEQRLAATDAMPVLKALQDRESSIQRGETITDSQGQIIGQKPLVINADKGSRVYVDTNGNGNGHSDAQEAFNKANGKPSRKG